MEKCKNHNMEIVHSYNFGYVSRCEECGKEEIYDVLSAEENAKKIMAGIILVGIIGSVICAVIDKIFN